MGQIFYSISYIVHLFRQASLFISSCFGLLHNKCIINKSVISYNLCCCCNSLSIAAFTSPNVAISAGKHKKPNGTVKRTERFTRHRHAKCHHLPFVTDAEH
ncbi:unnamed protein product [Owenia fusiformis]|uniref:Uncharacterized protein n=1 Tax=Owenia fusiformis TaxID=6347 RepID=A0A8S4PWW8_OWEFU|nr:unnamed protein product [Owenia fusiformis]